MSQLYFRSQSLALVVLKKYIYIFRRIKRTDAFAFCQGQHVAYLATFSPFRTMWSGQKKNASCNCCLLTSPELHVRERSLLGHTGSSLFLLDAVAGASVQKALVMSSLFPGRIRFVESRSQAETLKRKKGEKKLGETVEFVIEIANLKSMPD